jgi:hypothetical protein
LSTAIRFANQLRKIPGNRPWGSTMTVATLAAVVLTASWAAADDARSILDAARAVNDRREPNDVRQTLKMTIVDRGGGQRVRDMEMYGLRPGKPNSRTLMFFLSPPDVRGVGFLAWSHPDKNDDQWLYLPEFKRVRQITTSLRTQSFQGSDFTYQDLELYNDVLDWDEEQAESTLVEANAAADGVPCAVIALAPADAEITYGKLVLWIHRPDATVRRIDFYDRGDGAHVKTLAITGYAPIDAIPTAQRLEIATLTKGTRTVLEVSDVRYNQGLAEEDFTQRALERGRLR